MNAEVCGGSPALINDYIHIFDVTQHDEGITAKL